MQVEDVNLKEPNFPTENQEIFVQGIVFVGWGGGVGVGWGLH